MLRPMGLAERRPTIINNQDTEMGSVFKHKQKWYISYYFEGRRYRRAIGSNKKKAEEALKKIEGDIVSRRFGLPQEVKKISFEDLAEYWLEQYSKVNNSPSQYQKNRERLEKHLIPYFQDTAVCRINAKMIEEYIASKVEKIKPATINRTLSILSKMFNDAIRWGYLKENPMKQISKLREEQEAFNYLPQDEARKLLENCSEDFYPICCCALYTGMRVSEILGLKWKNVDLKERIITVEKSKGKRIRYIPIHQHLLEVLKKMKKNSSSELVFPNREGKIRKRDLRSVLNNALKTAGLRRIRFHDLRHTFASNFVMQGGSILSLQKILGHQDLKMTLRYAHLAPSFLQKEIEILDFTPRNLMVSIWSPAGGKVGNEGL